MNKAPIAPIAAGGGGAQVLADVGIQDEGGRRQPEGSGRWDSGGGGMVRGAGNKDGAELRDRDLSRRGQDGSTGVPRS